MAGLDTALSGLNNLALRATVRNDDFVDQLNHFATVSVLVFFAAITGVVEYASVPIDCYNYGDYLWQHFQTHVNSYCWTHNLYHYPNATNHSDLPYPLNDAGAAVDSSVYNRGNEFGQVTFSRFRWVMVIFIVQALLFKIPNLLWGEFNTYAGSDITKMVEMLQGVQWAKQAERKEKMGLVAFFLERWLRIHRKPNWFLKANFSPIVKKTMSSCTLCIGNNIRNYLSTMYLVTKTLYMVNVFLQFIILSAFLRLNFLTFGSNTLKAYFDDENTSTFPLVVLCHFQTLGAKVNAVNEAIPAGKWVQCILNINLFLEKMFVIEWIWLLVLLALTIISFLVWCFKILQTRTALKFVEHYMRLLGAYSPRKPVPKNRSVEEFVMDYLRNDGVFMLRILATNTNEVVVAELVEECWHRYLEFEENPHGEVGMEMTEKTQETTFSKADEETRNDSANGEEPPADPARNPENVSVTL